jgi:hypothetical protein
LELLSRVSSKKLVDILECYLNGLLNLHHSFFYPYLPRLASLGSSFLNARISAGVLKQGDREWAFSRTFLTPIEKRRAAPRLSRA